MKNAAFYLVLDVGTTAIKAVAFDEKLQQLARVAEHTTESYPQSGWVEQDPMEMVRLCRLVLSRLVQENDFDPSLCLGLGITNQRESVIVWDKKTGEPVYPAIIWKDDRTQTLCDGMRDQEPTIRERTGLALLPYFSATKLRWILDHTKGERALLFGTVDTWLLWNLCTEHPHVTDETNAARTLLYNIKTKKWDAHLQNLFGVSSAVLPHVLPSRAFFGTLDMKLFGAAIPVSAVCGDQQSSLVAAQEALNWNGLVTKVTCGTGTFISQTLPHGFRLLDDFFTTLAPGKTGSVYALEAKIDRGGLQVEPLLSDVKKLDHFLSSLADDIYSLCQRLPVVPKTVVLDGGVTRDGIIQRHLERKGLMVKTLPTFDGTARGIGILLAHGNA
ncbi:MAG: FGGY family carbohydrate kinase [bacterium]|nr:FGGY family carbohydrate kinase [bacterium]